MREHFLAIIWYSVHLYLTINLSSQLGLVVSDLNSWTQVYNRREETLVNTNVAQFAPFVPSLAKLARLPTEVGLPIFDMCHHHPHIHRNPTQNSRVPIFSDSVFIFTQLYLFRYATNSSHAGLEVKDSNY